MKLQPLPFLLISPACHTPWPSNRKPPLLIHDTVDHSRCHQMITIEKKKRKMKANGIYASREVTFSFWIKNDLIKEAEKYKKR